MGTDASEAFDNAGHSEDAFEIMAEYRIGKLKSNGRRPAPKIVKTSKSTASPKASSSSSSSAAAITTSTALLSLGAIGVGAAGYFYRSSIPGLDSLSSLAASSSSREKTGMGFIHGIMLSAAIFAAVDALVVKRAMKLLQPDHGGFMRYPPHMKMPRTIDPDLLLQSGWLDPATSMTLPLTKKTLISPNVYRFTFELPTPNTIVGLPTGQHVAITATLPGTGEVVTRSYTPVSNNSDRGVLELVIKIYPDGKLTGQYLANLEVGDEVSFRGPKGAMRFRTGAPTSSLTDTKPRQQKQLGMIAGGTGITPMYQLIRAICEDPRDTTRVSLIYANRSVDDILLRDELDGFARRYPKNFSVYYVVNTAPLAEQNGGKEWEGGVGFVNGDMMREKLAPAEEVDGGEKSRVMLCGPPGMVNAAKNALVELGFEKPGASAKMTDQIFVF